MRYFFFGKAVTVFSAQALRNEDASATHFAVNQKHVSMQKFRPKYA